MKRLMIIFVTAALSMQVFSQENFVQSGWINSEVELGLNSSDKLKQADHSSSSEKHASVWLESDQGWLKLHYSLQKKQRIADHFTRKPFLYTIEEPSYGIVKSFIDLKVPNIFSNSGFSIFPTQIIPVAKQKFPYTTDGFSMVKT